MHVTKTECVYIHTACKPIIQKEFKMSANRLVYYYILFNCLMYMNRVNIEKMTIFAFINKTDFYLKTIKQRKCFQYLATLL